MERNDGINEAGGATPRSDATEATAGGAVPAGASSSFDFSGTAAGATSEPGLRDRAREVAGSTGERLPAVGSTVRERAGAVKNRLADVLESGADRLRAQRTTTEGGAFAGVTAGGATTVQADGRLSHVSERVAGGMQASADWLRDADLDSMKASVEQQVREHPGRTLLIAAGVGYLFGRAFRGDR